MFENTEVRPMIAVKDLDKAKRFYQETLGLKTSKGMDDEILVFESGHSKIEVYRSQYAGTNKATAVTWHVRDLDGTVKSLKSKGVKFEHYDMPKMKREGDIHIGDGHKAAWFKDPDGNILSVASN